MAIFIVAIRLSSNGTGVEHITEVIWVNDAFKSGRSPTSAIITFIEDAKKPGKSGSGVVKVSDGKEQAVVEVVRPKVGEPYIRTTADATRRDNLLSLPHFS